MRNLFSRIRADYRAFLVFVGGAFLGPIFGLAMRPFAVTGAGILPPEIERLVEDVGWLLMPAGMLAVFEYSYGMVYALMIVIGVHLALYMLVGAVIVASARWLVFYVMANSALISLVVSLELWFAGFEYEYINGWALAIALGFYSSLALVAGRIVRRDRANRHRSQMPLETS